MAIWAYIQSIFRGDVMEDGKKVKRKYYVSRKKQERKVSFGFKTFFQIVAVRDFELSNGVKIKKGERGGWVASESCLSHAGNCWIDEMTFVDETSIVKDNAIVFDSLVYLKNEISGNATIQSSLIENYNKIEDATVSYSIIENKAELIGEINMYLSKIFESRLSGRIEIKDSKLRHVCVDNGYFEKEELDEDMEVRFNRVEMIPSSLHSNDALIAASCNWNDVSIEFDDFEIHEKTAFHLVTGNPRLLDVKSETELQCVTFHSDSTFETKGNRSKGVKHSVKGDNSSAIEVKNELCLYGNGNIGNLIRGNVQVEGSWHLRGCSLQDSAQLHSCSKTSVILTNCTLKDVSSIVINESRFPKKDVFLDNLVLTDDECYVHS